MGFARSLLVLLLGVQVVMGEYWEWPGLGGYGVQMGCEGGAARGGGGDVGNSGDQRGRSAEDQLAVIRALLAKAEATEFPHEADAFNAKAAELMAKFAIDEALIWSVSDTSDEVPTERRIEVIAPYLGPKRILINRVARAFGCWSIRLREGNKQREQVAICGFVSDLDLVDALVTSLFVQLAGAMAAAESQFEKTVPRSLTASERADWRRSFIVAFGLAAGERIEAHRSSIAGSVNDAGSTGRGPVGDHHGDVIGRVPKVKGRAVPSVALALRDRDSAARDEYRRRYPRVTYGRTSIGSSSLGRTAGSSAGKRADIGMKRFNGTRSLPK